MVPLPGTSSRLLEKSYGRQEPRRKAGFLFRQSRTSDFDCPAGRLDRASDRPADRLGPAAGSADQVSGQAFGRPADHLGLACSGLAVGWDCSLAYSKSEKAPFSL